MLTILGLIGIGLLCWRIFVAPFVLAGRIRRLERQVKLLMADADQRQQPQGGGGPGGGERVPIRRVGGNVVSIDRRR